MAQSGFRLEDNHQGVLESFQTQKLVMAWFCKRTDSKVFPCNLCLVRSIFVNTFPSVWRGKRMRINIATRVITMESESDTLKASVRGLVNRSRPDALSKYISFQIQYFLKTILAFHRYCIVYHTIIFFAFSFNVNVLCLQWHFSLGKWQLWQLMTISRRHFIIIVLQW